MMLQRLSISGYRSIRKLDLTLGRVNVVVGANGAGKTNLYRALFLLHASATGRLAASIVEEGGMASALWAGDRARGQRVRIILEARFDEFSYRMECGLPQSQSPFALDPEIKEEEITLPQGGRDISILKRDRAVVTGRDADGRRARWANEVSPTESALAELRDPGQYPVPAIVRRELASWRFYHQFRTDQRSQIRRPQPGTFTPILAHDGLDLAAALTTIMQAGGGCVLRDAIDRAFPGVSLVLDGPSAGWFAVQLQTPELPRLVAPTELSDGTLKYLCLCAALLSERPSPFLALNEPENSLHPDLIPEVARLVGIAADNSQILVTTHSRELAELLGQIPGSQVITLKKSDGQTCLVEHAAETK